MIPTDRETLIFNAMVLRVLGLAIENLSKYQRSILRPENAPKHLQIIAFSASQPQSLLSDSQEQPISHITQSRLDHSTICNNGLIPGSCIYYSTSLNGRYFMIPTDRETLIFNAMVLRVLGLAIENLSKYQRSILRPENAPKHLQIIAFSASQPQSLLSDSQEQPISHITQSRLDHSTICNLSINTRNPDLNSFRPFIRCLL